MTSVSFIIHPADLKRMGVLENYNRKKAPLQWHGDNLKGLQARLEGIGVEVLKSWESKGSRCNRVQHLENIISADYTIAFASPDLFFDNFLPQFGSGTLFNDIRMEFLNKANNGKALLVNYRPFICGPWLWVDRVPVMSGESSLSLQKQPQAINEWVNLGAIIMSGDFSKDSSGVILPTINSFSSAWPRSINGAGKSLSFIAASNDEDNIKKNLFFRQICRAFEYYSVELRLSWGVETGSNIYEHYDYVNRGNAFVGFLSSSFLADELISNQFMRAIVEAGNRGKLVLAGLNPTMVEFSPLSSMLSAIIPEASDLSRRNEAESLPVWQNILIKVMEKLGS